MKKILIVDSDEQITAVLGLKLRKENFEVKTLSSATKAIDFVKEFRPDLIISEMVLEDLSGVDFLKRVKMNPQTINTPFIFLSNSRNVEDKIIAHEMGAEAFFMKPIFIKVLINRIKDFFDEKNFKEMISSKDAKNFSGDLTSISVIDILNIISENKFSGEVELFSSTSEKAKIYFCNGSVIRVETDKGSGKNGIDELYHILSWLDGSFNIHYKDVSVPGNINIPHDRLLMRAVNWFEDYSGEMSEMPPTDSLVYVDLGQFLNSINNFPDGISEILKNIDRDEGGTISSIIEKTPFDKRQTIKYLKKMIEMKVLSLEKKTPTAYKFPAKPEWFLKNKKEEESLPESISKDDFEPSPSKEEISPESSGEFSENGKTLVPPPSFARKDTLDPILRTELNLDSFILNTAEKNRENSININIDILQEEVVEDKTEIIRTVQDEEIEAKKDSEHDDNGSELKKEDKAGPSSGGITFFVLIFLLFCVAAILAVRTFYPENFTKIMAHIAGEKTITENEIAEDISKDTEREEPKEKERAFVLTEKQKKMTELSVSELIQKSTELFDSEEYLEAIDTNKAALYKLKIEKTASGIEYEKVITNMAIFLYTDEKYDEALEFAEESLLLRDDDKAIELKAAILEELKKPAQAASIFRAKLNDEKFKHKKEEWMMEINRLENITQ